MYLLACLLILLPYMLLLIDEFILLAYFLSFLST